MKWTWIRSIIHWILLVMTVLYLITGLGITRYQIVEPLTFGLLNKFSAIRLHEVLLEPFVALLLIHILWGPVGRVYSALKKRSEQR